MFPEDKILNHPGGYDAFTFLTFLRWAMRFFGFTSIISLSILLPTNYSGRVSEKNATKKQIIDFGGHWCFFLFFTFFLFLFQLKDLPPDDPRHATGIDLWTMGNIDENRSKCLCKAIRKEDKFFR
jgi:hypothetical protein